MRRIRLAWGFLALGFIPVIVILAVRATSSDHHSPAPIATKRPYLGSRPPPGLHAPDFTLRSYRGNLVRMSDLRGKVVLVTFLDTKCTDKCPIIASQIAAALPLLPSAARRLVVAL